MNRYRCATSLLLCFLLYTAIAAAQTPQYTITPIDTPYFNAESLDQAGVVVGTLYLPTGENHPALWNRGAVTSLPINGFAVARNAAGVTVGGAYRTSPPWTVPLEWAADGSSILWPTPPFAVSGSATAINDHGEAVCSFEPGTSSPAPARCSAAGFTLLPTLGGEWSYAWAINNQGIAAGFGEAPDGYGHILVWDKNNQLRDYGNLGGSGAQLSGLNDVGQFAGWSSIATGEARAFGGDVSSGLMPLALPPGFGHSQASALNNVGVRVGEGFRQGMDGGVVHRAQRWDANGTVHDLNTLIDPAAGVILTTAMAINDAGQILAWASRPYPTPSGPVLLSPIVAPPSLALRLNQAAFRPGETLRMALAMRNPGPALTTEVYVGVILPDGPNPTLMTPAAK
jgi:uncharacterized membrane protein